MECADLTYFMIFGYKLVKNSDHYGIEYGKAMMKLRTLLDDRHNDDEIADRLKHIDADVHAMEDALKHDLDFRGLLIHL